MIPTARFSLSKHDAGQAAPSAVRNHDISAETVLANGHRWLRFPKAWEAAFREETLPQRLRLLAPSALVACLGVVIGSLNLQYLIPDVADTAWRLVWLWIALTVSGFATIWMRPQWWQQSWRIEAFTALQASTMSLLVTWMATQSRLDTSITHSAMACIPVMYSCIAVRQRFYWALSCTLVCFMAYAFLVTGFTQAQALIVRSNLGFMAVSYVFVLLANYFFEYGERRNWLLRKVEESQHQALMATSRLFQELCNQDPLTGLANRRAFDAHLEAAWRHAVANQTGLSLLVIDVDYFKAYNDSKGHPAGDDCLTRLSHVLQDIGRKHEYLVARLGGEEFGIVLPACSVASAEALGAEICRTVEAAAIPHGGLTDVDRVTVSVGGANASPAVDEGLASLLERADGALYQAKEQGRNRACFDAGPRAQQGEPAAVCVSRRWRDRIERQAPVFGEAHDGPLSFPSPDPEKESALKQTLESRFVGLRFPAEQERAYQDAHAPRRRKELVWLYMVGLLIFNLYILANHAMIPDIHAALLRTQLGVTGGLIALSVVSYMTPMPLPWREYLYGLGTSVIALSCVWVLSQSKLMSTLAFAAALALIPMFVAAGARQCLRATCMPALTTCAAAAWLLSPQDGVQQLVYLDTLFIIVMLTLFSLLLAYTLEHGQRKDWLLSQIDALQRQALETAAGRLQLLSSVDPLTGICNRRQFEQDLSRIWQEGFADRTPLAMLIIDVDHFKQYNDGYGHPQGDRCLKRIATVINQAARAERTLAARLGGEEFVILMPKARSVQAAARLGERVCQAVRDAGIEHAYSEERQVTVSVGVALMQPDNTTNRSTLFSAADKALYEAKHRGRNRVASYRDAPVGHPLQAATATPTRLSAH